MDVQYTQGYGRRLMGADVHPKKEPLGTLSEIIRKSYRSATWSPKAPSANSKGILLAVLREALWLSHQIPSMSALRGAFGLPQRIPEEVLWRR